MAIRLTTEQFIEKAKKVHGDKYVYSFVNYINNTTKVCIYCPIHKEVFWQTPVAHLKGQGCKYCAHDSYRIDQAEFIRRAIEIHGDKYDYKNVTYVNNHTEVEIFCKKHNEFFKQRPSFHLRGSDCPKCAKELIGDKLRKPLAVLIKEFNDVHNNYYDYSEVVYKDAHTNIKILCPNHGEFWQTPISHLNGAGHPNDMPNKVSKAKLSTTEEFIRRAREIHGDKYDYSKVEYIGCQINVYIICKEHGGFWQQPTSHLRGSGHPNLRGSNTTCLSQETVIKRFKDRHGSLYDYSQVKYVDINTDVCIIDPKWGEFWQNPATHWHGGKHPNTPRNTSKPELELRMFVKELGYSIMPNIRKIIKPYELDIFIPELNKAIEFNGAYWHYSDKYFEPGYHAMKSNLCRDKGIKLLHVREDLWLRDKEKMKETVLKFIKGGN